MILIESLLEQTIYAKHPLGWQISGTKKIIEEIKREDIVNYKNSFYQPRNMVLAVAGRVDNKVISLVKKYFGSYRQLLEGDSNFDFNPHTRKPRPLDREINGIFSISPREMPPRRNVGSGVGIYQWSKVKKGKTERLFLKFKKTEQVHLALGFPGFSYNHPDIYALILLTIILGGNMSSRLFIEVREKRGLAYFIRAGLNVYQDAGNLVIQAGIDRARIREALKVIIEELKKIRSQRIKSSELKNAQEFVRGQLILELEDSSHLAEWFAKQEILLNKILTPEEKIKKFFKVNISHVERVAEDIIKESALHLALIGPFKNKNNFLPLMKF